MPFAEGLKVTKCWIASIFFAVAGREFPHLQHWRLDGWRLCCRYCGVQTNNQPNKHADGRVLAGVASVKGYTAWLGAAWLLLVISQVAGLFSVFVSRA